MVTDAQVRLLRKKLMDRKTLETAAAAANMSVRSARTWKTGALPSEKEKKPRTWRTREDPFTDVWEREIVPLLAADRNRVLEATTLMQVLDEKHPGRFGAGQVRTLQRRLRDWRALNGGEREVFFEQRHVPGREGAFDFTHATELGVTIAGVLYPHLLFHFVLSFSGWTYVTLALSETYEALLDGLQGALWALGGVPEIVRSDNLSAATHELAESKGRALNDRFAAVLAHYGTRSTRISPGRSHENGVVENANGRIKTALRQALLIRGSSNFADTATYLAFVRDVVDRTRNRGIERALDEERRHLQPLPSSRVPAYTTYRPVVRRWSTVRVGGRIYSVPSRLIGFEVEARRHPDVVEIFYRGQLVETMPRVVGKTEHCIDYRHVIWSLVRKPGAFARYRFREELFPSITFRRAYDALCISHRERGDLEYVRILHLAASTMESIVERALVDLLDRRAPFDYAAVKALASPDKPTVPVITMAAPDLKKFDALIGSAR
jgi:transposase